MSIQIEKLHTTQMGAGRISRNLNIRHDDAVGHIKAIVGATTSEQIIRRGKNFYVTNADCTITINAHSHTIITAHKNKI